MSVYQPSIVVRGKGFVCTLSINFALIAKEEPDTLEFWKQEVFLYEIQRVKSGRPPLGFT